MGDMENYLGGEGWVRNAAGLGGGAVLGVIATRFIDVSTEGRGLHPLVTFFAKAAVAVGAGVALHNYYPNVASGIAFGGFTDATITYANQVQSLYLAP